MQRENIQEHECFYYNNKITWIRQGLQEKPKLKIGKTWNKEKQEAYRNECENTEQELKHKKENTWNNVVCSWYKQKR